MSFPATTLETNLNHPEQIIVCDGKGFSATLLQDHGLGFGQGSTNGVHSSSSSCGFHRPQHPEFPRNLRRRFNMRGYRGSENYSSCENPYMCHYDPEPFFDEHPPTYYKNGEKWSKDEYLAKMQAFHPHNFQNAKYSNRTKRPLLLKNYQNKPIDTTSFSNNNFNFNLLPLILVTTFLIFTVRLTIYSR